MNRARRTFSFRLITSSYLPIVGGSEIEAQRVCAELIRRGDQAEVFCPGGAPMPAEAHRLDEMGVPVRQFGTSANIRLRGYVFAAAVAWELWRTRAEYDLVYFLMTGAHVVSGSIAARLAGKPILMKFSGSNTIRPLQRSFIGRLQLRLLSRWAARIMVLNDAMRQEGCECGLDSRKFLWMPNPVNTTEFAPLPADGRSALRNLLGLAPSSEVILFVGRLAPEKELGSLIVAFSLVARNRPQAELVLVGDGPCRVELENSVQQMSLQNRVRFLGAQRGAEVRSWLQAADIFALVSSVEGLPVSLIEAMSTGLPSVVSDIPASTQLVQDGVTGLVVRLRDPQSVSHAIERLLFRPEDRARIGSAARERVMKEYSTDTVAGSYEALFTEVCGAAAQ